MSDWLRWVPGRGGTGYRKMLLGRLGTGRVRDVIGADAWVIHYPPGASIDPHVDPVERANHFRLNVVLATGGSPYVGDVLWRAGERIILFRPDRMTHSVPVCSGHRVLLSVGWATVP